MKMNGKKRPNRGRPIGIALAPVADKSVMSRGCADEAFGLVNGGRQDQYGKPERSFEALADVFTGLLKRRLAPGERVSPEDVALLMVGLKITRESNQRKRDNVVDAHGYLFLLGQLANYK